MSENSSDFLFHFNFFFSTLSTTLSCPALTHSHVWKGRVLRLQRTVTSQIRQRNADLQPGDRTMEWAIYGWLLTTLAFRPPYWKQVFYESACCLFPTTFIVRNLPLRKVFFKKKKKKNQAIPWGRSFKLHALCTLSCCHMLLKMSSSTAAWSVISLLWFITD